MPYGYAVYFTERAKNRVVRWEPDTGNAGVVAGEPPMGERDQMLRDPYGLAFDASGNLLIADKMKNRICRLRNGRLEEFVLRDTTGHRQRLPTSHPSYNPALRSPTGLFMEASGTLLCSFADDYTIYRIHPDGRLELVLGMVRNKGYAITEPAEFVPPPEVPFGPLNGPVGLVARADGTITFIERGPQVVREYHPGRGLRTVFPLAIRHSWRNHSAHPPDQGTLSDYHPAYAGSLALDSQERLYLTDVWHGSVAEVDVAQNRVRRVIQLNRPPNRALQGPAAVAFGPDGTAWVLDSSTGTVRSFQPSPSGLWSEGPVRLSRVYGQPIAIPAAGSGLITGA